MRLFTFSELMARIDSFRNHMLRSGADTAIITANSDLFYFTGSIQRGMLVIRKDEEPVWFVRKNLNRAKEESPIRIEPYDLAVIHELTAKSAITGVAYDTTSMAEFEFFKKRILAHGAAIVDISGALALTKMIKTEHEITLIREAASINRQVMQAVPSLYVPGMRDIDLQAEIESYAVTQLGHQGLFWIRGTNMEAGTSLVVTGETGLVPTYTEFPIGGAGFSPAVAQGASGAVIEKNVTVDFIGAKNGYCADSTRTFFIRSQLPEIRRQYDELAAMLKAVAEFMTPGITGEQVYNFATSFLAACTWKDCFMGLSQKAGFLGHGIGTEVNQLPVIAPRQSVPLAEGMVIALEPKVFIQGYGIIGLENTYLLENGSSFSLTGDIPLFDDLVIS